MLVLQGRSIKIYILSIVFYILIPHTIYAESNKLHELIQLSDFIGVIQISNAASPYSKIPKVIADTASGKIIKSIYNETTFSNSEKLIISSNPLVSPKNPIELPVFLRNGTFLVFLKYKDCAFSPVTYDSVMRVINGKVQPVWKEIRHNKKFKPPDLDLVIEEITQALNSPK